MIQHYVKFYYPGFFFAEDSVEAIDHRDPDKVEVPKSAYGFFFFDRKEIDDDGDVLQSDSLNESGTYFIGEVKSLDEIPETPENEILRRNMKVNGWTNVVKLECGWYQPFKDGDQIYRPLTSSAKRNEDG